MSRVDELAKSVWSDEADAAEWMRTPHTELAGIAPRDAEPEKVEALLLRLFFGIPT